MQKFYILQEIGRKKRIHLISIYRYFNTSLYSEMFKDSLRMIMKIYLRIKFSLIPRWQFVCTKISRHPHVHTLFLMIRVIFLCVRKGVTSSFLDKDAKDSFNVTTNTVLFFIIGDLMPYSKVSLVIFWF